jgi:hypothetical protein
MKVRSVFLFCVLASSAVTYAQHQSEGHWEDYAPRTLQWIVDTHREESKRLDSKKKAVLLTGDSFQSRVSLVYSGESRPLPVEDAVLLDFWRKMLKEQAPLAEEFATEVLFKEGSTERWIVVQKPLLDPLSKEVRSGQTVTGYVIWVGAIKAGKRWEWLFAMNGFDPH